MHFTRGSSAGDNGVLFLEEPVGIYFGKLKVWKLLQRVRRNLVGNDLKSYRNRY